MTRGRLIIILVAISTAAVFLSLWSSRQTDPIILPATTSTSTSAPATAPAAVLPVHHTLMDLVQAKFPHYATTQPLDRRLKLSESLHLAINSPVYLDLVGDLWITDRLAPPVSDMLAKANTQQVHLIPQPVLYVHWTTNSAGKRVATPICADAQGQPLWIDIKGLAHPLPAGDYDWHAAQSLDEWICVPTAGGASCFRWAAGQVQVKSIDFTAAPPLTSPDSASEAARVSPSTPANHAAAASLADSPATPSPAPPAPARSALPQAVLIADLRGLIAFIPADNTHPASPDSPIHLGAARFIKDQWQPLDRTDWPLTLMHVIPMVDGTALQVRADDKAGQVTLNWANLDMPPVPPDRLNQWVADLASTDESTRVLAGQQLINHGRAILPKLQGMIPQQPPAIQDALKKLIADYLTPSLADMKLIGNQLRVVDRQPNGAVLFYAEAGVILPSPDGSPGQALSPAWLLAQPGSAIRPVPRRLVIDRLPDTGRLRLINGDWIAIDASGPRLFLGNDLVYLTLPEERSYTELLGVDRNGRWVLGRPATPGRPTSTLLIDPFLPDARPHLPIWNIVSFRATGTGWDNKGYPGVLRGKSAWVLDESNWRALDEKKGESLTTAPPPATQPDLSLSLPTPSPTTSAGTSTVSPPATIARTSTGPSQGTSAPVDSAGTTTANSPGTTPGTSPGTAGIESTATAMTPPHDSTLATQPATSTVDANFSADENPPLQPTERNYLLTDHAGRKFYGGLDEMTVVFPGGKRITALLPAEAVGRIKPHLVEDANGALYLFNESGRIVRLRLDTDAPDLFIFEATFTRRVPQGIIRRAWLDPCKRLCFIAEEDGALFVAFPDGHIPTPLSNLIPDDLLDDPY